ncbi:TIGR02996 domain-containing protein [Frigoriglobus tundricola]|uniref:Repeat-companion domain protein n=1 Tax=Frigoriglobus tundricola TaxID=2774151 RepID=A0A6M5Z3T6_9BACT|nr:TIGR02996 domain-containing protein [Frigoriglobus tundricola]QJX00385.1 hypothetical protein FTUN_8014 [Frigoriglobus tundricola]
MNDRPALMAAIIAHPDEDTPRLALADWLQEHGDEHDRARAEFIRLQIQSAKEPDVKTRRAVESRAKKLEEAHRKAWLSPLRKIDKQLVGSGPGPRTEFTRGLLESVAFFSSDFLRKQSQPALADAFATVGVEALALFGPAERYEDWCTCTSIRWIAALTFNGGAAALAKIGRSPHCAHLGRLAFNHESLTDAGLKQFAKQSETSKLREFTVSGEVGHTIRGRLQRPGFVRSYTVIACRYSTRSASPVGRPRRSGWRTYLRTTA